jgi:hypothetical protein
MNPKTGQVYTVVNQDWGLRRGFKPCSTIKLVMGLPSGRMSSHGDDIEVTAIQLARMASAIGNGCKLLVPHLPRTPQENLLCMLPGRAPAERYVAT